MNITNKAIIRLFTSVSEKIEYHPYLLGFRLIEPRNKTAERLTDVEKQNFKTLVAHMCQIGSKLIHAEHIENAELKKRSLYTSMAILLALLIKDSYGLNENTRSLIVNFLRKTKIYKYIEEIIKSHSLTNKDFVNLYCGISPAYETDFFQTCISISGNGDPLDIMIPFFTFNTNELKPKDLPAELEGYWPF